MQAPPRFQDWMPGVLAVAVPAAALGLFAPIAFAVLVVAVIAAGRVIPGLWRRLAFGAVAGAVAGLVVLGPGLRLAMRVVAIMDPVRTPGFNLGETVFIIAASGIIGGAMGLGVGLIYDSPHRHLVAAVPAIIGLAVLLQPGELREELLHLGAGWMVNVPMFGAVFFGFGHAARRLAATVFAFRFRRRVEPSALV